MVNFISCVFYHNWKEIINSVGIKDRVGVACATLGGYLCSKGGMGVGVKTFACRVHAFSGKGKQVYPRKWIQFLQR